MLTKPGAVRPSSRCLLTLVLLTLTSLLLLPGPPSTAEPRTVEEAAPGLRSAVLAPRARLLTGKIRRDTQTLEAIRSTADSRLPPHRQEQLRLLLTKSRYRLDVMAGERLLKVFPIALSRQPRGTKERQGDLRTPQGDYELIPHHPSPNFGPSFYVCYPGPGDASRALARGMIGASTWLHIQLARQYGVRPPYRTSLGGLILIHGTRDGRKLGLTQNNWTEGCIAMENDHLRELLGAFSADDRPLITIRR